MQNKTVHFIIPSYKGQYSIQKCLDSIQNQTYPKQYIQISVIENGPRDGIEEIIHHYDNCTYHYNPIQGRSEARNFLLDQIASDFIAYIDVDVELSENWLQASLEAIQSLYCAAVTGPVFKVGDQWLDRFRKTISDLTTGGVSNILENPHYLGAINTAASLFRTSALKAVGGFDTSFKRSEDYELTHRLLRSGYTLATTEKATASVYWDRSAFEYFITRFFQMGYYSSKVYYKHQVPFSFSFKIPPWGQTELLITLGWLTVSFSFIFGQIIGKIKFKSTPVWAPFLFKKKFLVNHAEKLKIYELNPQFEILNIRGVLRLYSREKKSFLIIPEDVRNLLEKILKNSICNIDHQIDKRPFNEMIEQKLALKAMPAAN